MPTPTFSIIICNYNHGHYLRQCLAGILRQTFTDFEIVITDDGSTDGSQKIIAEFAANDVRIQPNYFTENRGAMEAVKDLWARARGRYIFGEGADDFILDERFLEKASAGMDAYPKAAGFFGVAGMLSVERNSLTGKIGMAPCEGYNPPKECYRNILRNTMFVPGSSSIWRRACIEQIGGFDYSLGPQIDFLVNHALPSRHGVVFTHTPVTCQRVYESRSNYGSKGGTLWEATGRLARVEKKMRECGTSYEGMEEDWRLWRAHWTILAINTTGVQVSNR